MNTTPLSPEDAEALTAVRAWRDRLPAPDIRALPKVSVPALGGLRRLIPDGGAQRALALAYAAALRLSPASTVLSAAGARSVEALRLRPLTESAALSRRLSRRDLAWAGGSGTLFGLAGAAGMAADAPALVVLALRALMRVTLSHGEWPTPALAAAIFALASADSTEEKRLAWNAALSAGAGDDPGRDLGDAALRDGLERAAEREFAKQALSGSLQKLGLSLVQQMGWRKAAGALPVLGAAVGGAVNARFIAQVAEAARQACAARRLEAQGHPLRWPEPLGSAETVDSPARIAAAPGAPRRTRTTPRRRDPAP